MSTIAKLTFPLVTAMAASNLVSLETREVNNPLEGLFNKEKEDRIIREDNMMLSVDSEERSVFEIISSTVTNDDGLWKKTCCDEGGGGLSEEEVLDCGKPVNFTYYDHLNGIHNRQHHPHIPEPDVALYFKTLFSSKKSSGGSDTQKTIECFRRALAVSPYNAAVLLNLARVFYNLQLLDDAIFLTRRSLEVQPPDTNAWLQHFQLGEILKAFRSYQEAALHFRHVLELKPGYGPALLALQDMESIPDSSVQINGISSSSNSYGSGSHRPSLKKLQIRNKNSHNSRG
ncbi:unnamed protein product [Lepeophtheirus salmonis]|uniref:(salmon louse) hypothetical protein n=1 Tax=Lepeophtheirus salmonis TaxID=72036 RepID=A0A7R8CRS5_LEPSM|nr:unnamed protein product [Lepeophtheirus salmonis]CAF2905622.1 unnamed protein product [Lepeophtheirus salmonis]